MFKFLRKRKHKEDASEEGQILAVGGGSSSKDVLTTNNEVKGNKAAKNRNCLIPNQQKGNPLPSSKWETLQHCLGQFGL